MQERQRVDRRRDVLQILARDHRRADPASSGSPAPRGRARPVTDRPDRRAPARSARSFPAAAASPPRPSGSRSGTLRRWRRTGPGSRRRPGTPGSSPPWNRSYAPARVSCWYCGHSALRNVTRNSPDASSCRLSSITSAFAPAPYCVGVQPTVSGTGTVMPASFEDRGGGRLARLLVLRLERVDLPAEPGRHHGVQRRDVVAVRLLGDRRTVDQLGDRPPYRRLARDQGLHVEGEEPRRPRSRCSITWTWSDLRSLSSRLGPKPWKARSALPVVIAW